MKRCLTDRQILFLYDGGGTGIERKHLRQCESCAGRYRLLEQDLKMIGAVLREAPARQQSHAANVRWIPGAAVLAVALLLVWAGVGQWDRYGQIPVDRAAVSESRGLLDEFPFNPFLLTEALAVELAAETAGSYDLAATFLESERPCEWYDLPAPTEPLGGFESSPGTPFVSCMDMGQNQSERSQRR